MRLFFPSGILLKEFPRNEGKHDFAGLSEYMQLLKRTFQNKDIEKRDIVILSEPDTSYQTIVYAMDTVRSYKAVVVASVVDAELFPDVSLGDAPELVKVPN